MIDTLLPPVLLCAGLTAALVAGVFLTFSDFLMRALGETAPAAGAEAMQRINVDVFRSVFMVLFLGSVPLALLLAATGLFALSGAPATWVISGAGLYVVGVFAVTALGNVPMNAHLARL